MSNSPPHPIPYQGSKRLLAAMICGNFPPKIRTLYEPFAGSAAITVYAASHSLAKHYVIGDISAPLANLLNLMINSPLSVTSGYRDHWIRGIERGTEYFYEVRRDFNQHQDPVDLLYLTCRAVKNSVRYSSKGMFTQSVDKRRRGTHPDTMRRSVLRLSELLRGRSTVLQGDWRRTTETADTCDFVYLDPPYEGVSTGSDRRYVAQMSRSELFIGLEDLNSRGVPFALSYDGKTGSKTYGQPVPTHLYESKLMLNAGVSTQSTLNGENHTTFESLYLSMPSNRRNADLTNVGRETPAAFDIAPMAS